MLIKPLENYAQLAIAFNIVNKFSVWNFEHSLLKQKEFLKWMTWLCRSTIIFMNFKKYIELFKKHAFSFGAQMVSGDSIEFSRYLYLDMNMAFALLLINKIRFAVSSHRNLSKSKSMRINCISGHSQQLKVIDHYMNNNDIVVF